MIKITALFLSLCLLGSFLMPLHAAAASSGEMNASVPSEHAIGTSVQENKDNCSASLGTSGQENGVSVLSGWGEGDSEFYTRIRLTASDYNGNPVEGVIYGLYRADDNSMVQQLITDSYGIAVSEDVPVDTDYYLLELYAPYEFLPNSEPKYIYLRDTCTPSRVDEHVIYDPITGQIKIIKTDEDGNRLSGVGFHVYRESDWEHMDTVYTDDNGEAITVTLPYGWYAFEEFDMPEGMAGAGYVYQNIEYHEEVHELYIANYSARGSVCIYKTGSDERVIGGAVFSIYTVAGDEWIEDITTGSGGYAYSHSLLLGDYYAVEKSVPFPYQLNTEQHFFTVSYEGQTEYIAVVNEVSGEAGEIRIRKTDDSPDPVPLSGVIFGLYRTWDDKKIAEITTQDDGTATFTLPPDDYYFMELLGKQGYTMVSGQTAFTIDGSGVTVEKTIVNPRIRIFGKVKVIKTDEERTPIPFVRFGVYCQSGNLLEEIVTDADGLATSGVLNEGTGYYLVELEEVTGHVSDTETHYPFDITENGEIVSVHVTNPRITGGIQIIKDDGEGNSLSGVVFGLYKNGIQLAELTTLEDGTATKDGLYYGTDYELREISTIEGYGLMEIPIPFSILEQDVVVTIPVSNARIRGSLTIIKVDAEDIANGKTPEQSESTDSLLAGAVFGLYNDSGQKISELTVDRTGSATYEGLTKANYFIKELVAPEGYTLADELIPFAINEQGEHVELVVPNVKGFSTVKIIKHGEGERLSGVVFDLYRTATNEHVMELTSGENGEVSQQLPLGHYYLIEKSTVSGYLLPSGRISFSLTEADETVELSIQNQKEPTPEGGRIKLLKKSSADGAMLSGAVFGLFRASDNEKIGELVTGTTGIAFSEILPQIEMGYYVLELTAPTHFKLLTEKIPVAIQNGEYTEITVENEPILEPPKTGELVIIKASKTTGARLQNAVFGVYRASDDLKITELTTQSDGRASLSLPEGDYYCIELVPPPNFKLNDTKFSFHISTGESKEIIVLNELADPLSNSGKLILVKSADGSGERLKNATFDVYLTSDNTRIAQITTDKNGEAELLLPEDRYYLRESSAPEQYILDSRKIHFAIKENETVLIRVTNKLKNRPLPYDPDPTDDGDDSSHDVEITTLELESESIPLTIIEEILLPKTGEAFPIGAYTAASLCFALQQSAVGLFIGNGKRTK